MSSDKGSMEYYRDLAGKRGERILSFYLASEQAYDAITGLLEIAEIAMPDTYFATDSRVDLAKKILSKLNRLTKSAPLPGEWDGTNDG